MSTFADYATKLNTVYYRKLAEEARVFASSECFFQPISFIMFIVAIVFAFFSHLGYSMPTKIAYVFPISLSAAVGYLTNWFAIEMLFKPYKCTWHHPFAWQTGGYWHQGVVPRNKGRIAFRAKFKVYVRAYFETHFAETIGVILHLDELCEWVSSLIPRFRPELENLIRTKGLPLIVDKLDSEGLIKTTVDTIDVEEFHSMVNKVSAQHFGVIQVLGYLLGAIAGALLLSYNFDVSNLYY